MDAIWLTPFYVSPQIDNGYDVANYTAIDPAYGTLDDFEQQERNAAQPQAEALQRSALQMRMTELIGRIATASAREKPALEAAYEACLREYRELKQ